MIWRVEIFFLVSKFTNKSHLKGLGLSLWLAFILHSCGISFKADFEKDFDFSEKVIKWLLCICFGKLACYYIHNGQDIHCGYIKRFI